jgi:hypothetical protein
MFKKISEKQSGFKADCSTIDNAFILKSIFDHILRNKRRKLYVAFVDLLRGFNTDTKIVSEFYGPRTVCKSKACINIYFKFIVSSWPVNKYCGFF